MSRAPARQTLFGPGKRRAVEPLIRQSGHEIELQAVGRVGRPEQGSVLRLEPTQDQAVTMGEINADLQAESSVALNELFSERPGG